MAKRHTRKTKTIMSNRNLFLAGILSFGLTFAASVTSTYAWFEVSEHAKVSQLDFSIRDAADFEIGLKNNDGDYDYYRDVNDEILETHFSRYRPNSVLHDLSSNYQSLWLNEDTNPETDFPVLRRAYADKDKPHQIYVAQSGYYQFEFFLKSNRDMYLFLDANHCYAKPLHDLNATTAAALKNVTAEELDHIVNACRVSFYSSMGFLIWEPNASVGSTTVFGGALDLNGDGYYDDLDGKEVVYGEYSDDDPLIYDEAPTADILPSSDTHSSFVATHRAGIAPFNLEKSEAAGLSFAKETTYTLADLSIPEGAGQYDSNTMHPLLALKAGVSSRLVVTIYLEGWDLDMIDSIGEGHFTLGLGFQGLVQPLVD